MRVLDNLCTGFYENISRFKGMKSFEFIEGDIRDIDVCLNACKEIDYVSHQAALGSVPRSIEDPILTNDVNITGFLNIISAAKKNKVKRFIYAASSSTYGSSLELPKKEDLIGMPLSPYAVTKYVNELYASVFERIYSLSTVGLRYFNVFGPRQSPNGPYAAVIPLAINSMLNNQPFYINGDGLQTRDFTYVQNVVQANIKAISANDSLGLVENKVFNIAKSSRITINDLVEEIKSIFGTPYTKVIYRNKREGDVLHSFASIERAEKILNYQPYYTVRQGLIETINYFKTQYNA